MVGPWVFYLETEEEPDVGDLEYIQGFVTAGNYFHVITDISIATNLAEFIVPNNQTAFLIEAKITMSTNPSSSAQSDQVVATLQTSENAGATITEFSKAKIGEAVATYTGVREIGGSGYGVGGYCPFNVLGFSLVGNGTDTIIQIENTVDGGNAVAEFSGYLIDT